MPLRHAALTKPWITSAATTLVQAEVLVFVIAGQTVAAAVGAVLGIAAHTIHAALSRRRIIELESELAEANTDPVTGLSVRRIAERRIVDAAGIELTVAVIDVDGMHDINTEHTHVGGDAYLLALAERLRSAAEPGDLVARLGGDEFVLITTTEPRRLGDLLTAALALPAAIDETLQPIRVSVGICRTWGGDPHTALGRSDRAMYTAKRSGSAIAYFDPARDGEPHAPHVRPAVRRRDQPTWPRFTKNG